MISTQAMTTPSFTGAVVVRGATGIDAVRIGDAVPTGGPAIGTGMPVAVRLRPGSGTPMTGAPTGTYAVLHNSDTPGHQPPRTPPS